MKNTDCSHLYPPLPREGTSPCLDDCKPLQLTRLFDLSPKCSGRSRTRPEVVQLQRDHPSRHSAKVSYHLLLDCQDLRPPAGDTPLRPSSLPTLKHVQACCLYCP